GLLAGGAQCTGAVMRQSCSTIPSPAATACARLASPARCRAAYSHSPDRSPVNIRPVRLAPWAAGANPTTRNPALGSPKDGDVLAPVDQSRAGPADAGAGGELGEVAGVRGEGLHRLGGVGHRGGTGGQVPGPAGPRRDRGVERVAGERMPIHPPSLPLARRDPTTGRSTPVVRGVDRPVVGSIGAASCT